MSFFYLNTQSYSFPLHLKWNTNSHDKSPDELVPACLFNTILYCFIYYASDTLANFCLFLTHGQLATDLPVTGFFSATSLQLKSHMVREAFYSI